MGQTRTSSLQSWRRWLSKHHGGVREWLLLFAAVAAGIAGWQQISDERDARKASEERLQQAEIRSQAEQVSAWIALDGDQGMEAVLANRSSQPVYQVIIWRVVAYGGGAHTGRERRRMGEGSGEDRTFVALPPGEYSTMFPYGFGGMGAKPGVEISFRDQAGRNWIRTADGTLSQINSSPITFYKLSESQEWGIPKPRT